MKLTDKMLHNACVFVSIAAIAKHAAFGEYEKLPIDFMALAFVCWLRWIELRK